jgi:hypothetical protein
VIPPRLSKKKVKGEPPCKVNDAQLKNRSTRSSTLDVERVELEAFEASKLEERRKIARDEIKKRKLADKKDEGVLMWAWKESANGESGDVKYSRAWDASLYLTAADKMCDNQNNRCKVHHGTVLKECLHVLGSRLIYDNKKNGSAAFIANEVKTLGCLYKEIRLEVNDENKDTHCVGSVMVYERNLCHIRGDAIMIKCLATSIAFEGQGLASSFFRDLCLLHHEYTQVFAMVMNPKAKIPVKCSRTQSPDNISSGPPKDFYARYGFVEDVEDSNNFSIDRAFIEPGCIVMYTQIMNLRLQTYSPLQLNARTLDIDPTVINEMRWNPSQNQFEGVNIHFPNDVIVVNPRQCAGIASADFCDRRKEANHMKYRKLRPGNRLTNGTCPSTSTVEEIPSLFQGRSNESGECLWAAAALLIHSMNQFAGISMMHYYTHFPDRFQWLSMYTCRATKRTLATGSMESDSTQGFGLSSLLTENTDFNLHKIKGQNGPQGNLEYVKQVKSGYYVCNLMDQNGFLGHCIGIWKKTQDTGFIYDCRETHVLEFSITNIDQCCGKYSKCISIPHIGEIRYKRGKG